MLLCCGAVPAALLTTTINNNSLSLSSLSLSSLLLSTTLSRAGVPDYEAASRSSALVEAQLETHNFSREAFRIRYRFGQGTTEQLLGLETKGDRLSEQLVTAGIKKAESVRELLPVTWDEANQLTWHRTNRIRSSCVGFQL